MIWMPGKSYEGTLAPLGPTQRGLRERLYRDVEKLASEIGERNVDRYAALVAAADYIDAQFADAGYQVRRQGYELGGMKCDNLVVQLEGALRPDQIVIVGAHYDSVVGSPGANDNATGIAAVLQLARLFGGRKPARTLRFVTFVNEEPPHFQTDLMGSMVYAKACRQAGENIVAMIAFDGLGYYSEQAATQSYPPPFGLFYPSKGNFIAFVGNTSSRQLVRKMIGSFRKHAQFPSEGAAIPGFFPGAGWSDHWAFWKQGYPGVMVSDTLPYRDPYYHTSQDTIDNIDFDRMTRVVVGMEKVIEDLAGPM